MALRARPGVVLDLPGPRGRAARLLLTRELGELVDHLCASAQLGGDRARVPDGAAHVPVLEVRGVAPVPVVQRMVRRPAARPDLAFELGGGVLEGRPQGRGGAPRELHRLLDGTQVDHAGWHASKRVPLTSSSTIRKSYRNATGAPPERACEPSTAIANTRRLRLAPTNGSREEP